MAVPLEQFITDYYVKRTWIGFFTLWVLWGLVYAIRFTVKDNNKPSPQDPETGATTSDKKPYPHHVSWKEERGGGTIRMTHFQTPPLALF